MVEWSGGRGNDGNHFWFGVLALWDWRNQWWSFGGGLGLTGRRGTVLVERRGRETVESFIAR